jgi:peroxiredoxin
MELKIEIVSVLKRKIPMEMTLIVKTVGHKPLVIYIYRRTILRDVPHRHSFRDRYEDFKDLGAEVIELAVTASSPIKNSQNNINYHLFLFRC